MTRLPLFTAVLLGLSLAQPALAQHCDIPRVMLTVDRSSSMLGAATDGLTKWDAASVAISDVTMAYEGRIDFGLSVFPYPDRCQPGEVVLDFGQHPSTDIVEALGGPPPSAGNWTPMAQTLDAAGAYLGPSANGVHLVLVTDGWQWCSPYSATTRFDPVTAVTNLRAMGMTVHVVGFGAEVDALTLNRAAVAGGAPLAGCDPTLSDPAASGHCYAQVGDLTGLRGALESIARSVTSELCNGLDDDCDGVVDEGFDVDGDGFTTCGEDCDDTNADVHPGGAELCDGLDEDCDGVIDPGCACTDGDAVACGSSVGVCRPGLATCTGGAFGSCEGSVSAGPESCDGSDQDCDGTIDEDVHCAAGFVCLSGACTELMPQIPPTPVAPIADDDGIDHGGDGTEGDMHPELGGCACSAHGNAPVPAGLIVLGLALGLVARRRR
jgi:MYXO-CTERM domain-containing protein